MRLRDDTMPIRMRDDPMPMRADTMPVLTRGDTNSNFDANADVNEKWHDTDFYFNAEADAGANDDTNANLSSIIFVEANAKSWW